MKTKMLLLGAIFSLAVIGCNRDDDNNNAPIAANDVQANSQMDNIADDVLAITEMESDEFEVDRTAGGQTFIAGCATISTEQNGNTWIRTIDFGTNNCTLYNGNEVRGKIILTFTNDFDAATRTISYSFDNFYHNDRHVEGNRTVIKSIVNGHPHAEISLNMIVTLTNGTVFTRVGDRVRDFISGFDTPFFLSDDVFSITGSWATTVSTTGITHTATINSPVIVKWNCAHIVSGTITFVRSSDNASAILDYGNGDCDDDATLTINGNVYNINL